MKITRINVPFPAISIDDFIPTPSLVRAAANSFEEVSDKDWVMYWSVMPEKEKKNARVKAKFNYELEFK